MAHGQATHAVMLPVTAAEMVTVSVAIVSEFCATVR